MVLNLQNCEPNYPSFLCKVLGLGNFATATQSRLTWMPRNGNVGNIVPVWIIKDLADCFPKCPHHFIYSLAVHERSDSCQHMLPHVVLLIAIPLSVNWHLLSFVLLFPHSQWFWVPFHVLIDQLHIFSGDITIQIFCAFLNWILFSCKSSLYTQDTSSLSDTWFLNFTSHSVGCLFTFFMMTFEGKYS
jgi:hypothetical protein